MHILIINHRDITHPQTGGLEEIVHETAKRWVAWGHTADVLCSGFTGAPKEEIIEGVRYMRGPREYVFHWWVPFKVRTLRHKQYDIMLEYMSKIPSFLPLFERKTPIAAMIPHLFGTTIFEELPGPIALFWCWLEKLIPLAYTKNRFWVNSESTAKDLKARGIPAEKIEVIYAGVYDALFEPNASVHKTPYPSLVYVGRLKQYKHIDFAIRAIKLLQPQFPHIQLRIVGQGSAEEDLQRLAGALALEGSIKFYGYVSEEEKKTLLLESWLGVQTSSNEGWGLAVTEAGACGLPTIASDSPGLRESVREGETGFLVPHGNIEKLAEKITALLTDSQKRHAMGMSAKTFATQFSWENTAKYSLEFLETISAKKQMEEKYQAAQL